MRPTNDYLLVWNNAELDVDSIMNMRGLNVFLFLMNLITFVRFLIDGCLLGDRANRMEDAYHLSCMYIWTTWRQIQIYWYWQMLIQKFGISEIIYPVHHLIIRRYRKTLAQLLSIQPRMLWDLSKTCNIMFGVAPFLNI